MPFYWTLGQVPELGGLSPAERRRVHRACYWQHAFRSPRCILALVVCGLCPVVGGAAGGRLLHFLFDTPLSFWYGILGAAIGGGIGGAIFGQTVTSYLRPFYAAYVKSELRRVDA